jgi:hypothetical protein
VRIFCQRCQQHVLDSTDEFVPGGVEIEGYGDPDQPGKPLIGYHGGMFQPPDGPSFAVGANYFLFDKDTILGSLCCPRCDAPIVAEDRTILTEHGLVHKGMKKIDETVTIVHSEGEHAGELMFIKDAVLMTDEQKDAEVEAEAAEKAARDKKIVEIFDWNADEHPTYAAIADEVGCSPSTVKRVLVKAGLVE